ncbi:MAG: hypothetical protein OXF01_11470 [Gemmatimonadetes bacterium]|nr:hypothetical protein [Gemmatimonadota bacterium]
MKLEVLRAATPTAAIDLRDARGLVAFVSENDAAWGGYLAAIRASFAARGRLRGPGSVVRGEATAATVGTAAFEAQLGKVLAKHALRREEYAAVWLGTGPPRVWVAAAVALLQGPETTRRIWEGAARGKPGAGRPPSRAGVEAGWVGELVREARAEVERLTRLREGVGRVEERLGGLRGEAAVVQGDAEAAAMAWVRERQDAETRLLLYRDREKELRGRLEQIRKGGEDAACANCDRPLGDRTDAVRRARREEWEAVVQDGKWWRRRRSQLELKPEGLKSLETRALELSAEIEDLAEELQRHRAAARELEAVAGRLERLLALEARLAGRPAAAATPSAEAARGRFRAQVHARLVGLGGGRFASTFPELYSDWTAGKRADGEAEAALELAARLTLAEMAADAGVRLGSIVLPSGLERLGAEDLPRALAELVGLAKRIPLVLAKATPQVVAGAPECFDLVYRFEASGKGSRVRRQRLGLATIWLQGD